MNRGRILLSALVGTIVYFICGFVAFGLLPLANEFRLYPTLYRPMEGIQKLFPVGIAATFVAILVLAFMYAKGYEGRGKVGEGARFGMLVGVFSICAFVLHNYVNLNMGLKLTLEQAVLYFVEWTLVGVAIGLTYQPAAART